MGRHDSPRPVPLAMTPLAARDKSPLLVACLLERLNQSADQVNLLSRHKSHLEAERATLARRTSSLVGQVEAECGPSSPSLLRHYFGRLLSLCLHQVQLEKHRLALSDLRDELAMARLTLQHWQEAGHHKPSPASEVASEMLARAEVAGRRVGLAEQQSERCLRRVESARARLDRFCEAESARLALVAPFSRPYSQLGLSTFLLERRLSQLTAAVRHWRRVYALTLRDLQCLSDSLREAH